MFYDVKESIAKNGFVFNEGSINRDESFQTLGRKLKNERDQISTINRYGNLLEILEIMKSNKSCLLEMKNREFFDADFSVFSKWISFENEVNKIVKPFYETLIKSACEMNNDQNDSEEKPLLNDHRDDSDDINGIVSNESIFEALLSNIENEIKQKVKDEIIDYIERNSEDKDKLISVMNDIYFRKMMGKIHLVDSGNKIKENKDKIKIAIGAAAGAVLLGVTLATIPAWPVLLPFGLEALALTGIGVGGAVGGITIGGGIGAGVGKAVDIVSENCSLNFVKKFCDELYECFTNFLQQTKKYPDLKNREQDIYKEIECFKTKMDTFKSEYLN